MRAGRGGPPASVVWLLATQATALGVLGLGRAVDLPLHLHAGVGTALLWGLVVITLGPIAALVGTVSGLRSWPSPAVAVLVALVAASGAVAALHGLGGEVSVCRPGVTAGCVATPAQWIAALAAVETVLGVHAASRWSARQLADGWRAARRATAIG